MLWQDVRVHSIYVMFMIGTCRGHRVDKEAYSLAHLLISRYIFDNARYKNKKAGFSVFVVLI
jgi:hypothetical protein